MNVFERFQTVIILSAVGIGLLLGQFVFFETYAESFIVPFLLLMLYGLFLSIPLQHLQDAFKNRKFFNTSTTINFVWTPVLAWGIGVGSWRNLSCRSPSFMDRIHHVNGHPVYRLVFDVHFHCQRQCTLVDICLTN